MESEESGMAQTKRQLAEGPIKYRWLAIGCIIGTPLWLYAASIGLTITANEPSNFPQFLYPDRFAFWKWDYVIKIALIGVTTLCIQAVILSWVRVGRKRDMQLVQLAIFMTLYWLTIAGGVSFFLEIDRLAPSSERINAYSHGMMIQSNSLTSH